MQTGFILPFQFCTDTKLAVIEWVKLYSLETDTAIDITDLMLASGLDVYSLYDYSVIQYSSNAEPFAFLTEGSYYLAISNYTDTYYSEVFTVVPDVSNFLRLEWELAKRLDYTGGMAAPGKSVLYINAELGKPDYVFEEEGTSRDGLFFPEKQLSQKKYRFIFLASEYVCDSIRFAQMADLVTVQDKHGRIYTCDTIQANVDWQEQGDLASVEVEFTTGQVLKKTGNSPIQKESNDYNYLTFTAVQAYSTVKANRFIAGNNGWEFSTNGVTWHEATDQVVTLPAVGSKVMFRGKGCIGYNEDPGFTMRGKIKASGSIMSLVDWENQESAVLKPKAFQFLFAHCKALISAPELPAVELSEYCYEFMFWDCTSLVYPPSLPALTLVQDCYLGMFSNCTSLTYTPDLPATTLATNCYVSMFNGCIALKETPAIVVKDKVFGCMQNMFADCTSLERANKIRIESCGMSLCINMFDGCTSLVEPPELLATYIDDSGYKNMFKGCISLKKAPSISAETVLHYGCQGMFEDCKALTETSDLTASAVAYQCYKNMFKGCTSLKKAPSVLSVHHYSCESMFSGCTSLVEAPTLPAVELPEGCYYGMFANCTSLVKAPAISAKSFQVDSFKEMFAGCASLMEVHLDVESYAESAFTNWLLDVAPTGTLHCAKSIDIPKDSASGIPVGWNVEFPPNYLTFTAAEPNSSVSISDDVTFGHESWEYSTDGDTWQSALGSTIQLLNAGDHVKLRGFGYLSKAAATVFSMTGRIAASGSVMSLIDGKGLSTTIGIEYQYLFQYLFYQCVPLTTAPELPATTLASSCYDNMFRDCSSLVTAPKLPATTLASACYQDMFRNCSSLVTAPELPATTLANWCYYSMFENCSSLVTAPELPATTLNKWCYNTMFKGCQALSKIVVSAKTWSTDNSSSWLTGVASSGIFECYESAGIPLNSSSGVPSGWTVEYLEE
jgi:hypothetical protein